MVKNYLEELLATDKRGEYEEWEEVTPTQNHSKEDKEEIEEEEEEMEEMEEEGQEVRAWKYQEEEDEGDEDKGDEDEMLKVKATSYDSEKDKFLTIRETLTKSCEGEIFVYTNNFFARTQTK